MVDIQVIHSKQDIEYIQVTEATQTIQVIAYAGYRVSSVIKVTQVIVSAR